MTQTEVASPPRIRGFVGRHKALLAFLVLVLILLLSVGGWAFYLNSKIVAVNRFELDLPSAERPARVEGKAENILLVGVDDGKGADLKKMLDSGSWESGAFRSDTIMVLHIRKDRKNAELISIPRDSYVPVPGYGRTKINAAFSYGGPGLLTKTVEDFTGIYLDHVAVVDWAGFAGITTALGGAEVFVPDTPASAEDGLEPGMQNLQGKDALAYVRERKSLPGGDFDRVQRQQNVLRSVLKRSRSRGVLANPFKVTDLLGEVTKNLSVSDSFTTGVMRNLALSTRSITADDVRFATIPVLGTPTIDGASVVTVSRPAVQKMFEALANDDFETYLDDVGATMLPGKRDVD